MNFKYIISSLFLLFLAFGACTEDERGLETQGYLELGVSKNVEVITRGFDVEDQSLAVDICAGANDSIVKHFSDYNDMAGDRVLLDVGTYKVKVSSNPTSKLEFEQPTFYGEKTNVAVTAGKTTAVSVECFLSCVKVTTEFTEPVRKMFKSVIARISDDKGFYLDYGLKETRAGYFQPGYILVDLTLTNKEGLEFKMSKLIDKTEARDHYHLVFDMIDSGDDNSGMDFDITIEDDPTNDENHTVTIPLPETGYGQEPPVVKFVDGEGKEIENNSVSFLKGSGAQTMFVKTVSSNIGLQSVTLLSVSSLFENKSIPSSLDLLKLSEDDKTKLSEIGLTIPTLEDAKKEFSVDFSTLLSEHLPGGTHKFTIVSRDVMGHEKSETITIIVNLSVSTHPIVASEVWAHYATLRGFIQGASEAGKESYKFQYKKKSEGDDAWKYVEGPVTVLSAQGVETNITQVVTYLDANTDYVYRLTNEGTPSNIIETFKTEEEIALTNGNFEDDANGPWNITDGVENPTTFWSSGNNSITKDLAVKEVVNNNAIVKMQSKMAGIGMFTKFAAGNAFTGAFTMISDINMDKAGGIVKLGKSFTSRPSSLKGIYKYTPVQIKNGGDIILSDGTKVNVSGEDRCAIYIVLLTDIIAIDTRDQSTLFSVERYKNQIVAFAELKEDGSTNNEYKEFNLKLDYLNSTIRPKYIGIMCTSSKYGDYFMGGEGSVLCIDNLELIYSQEPISQ